MKTLFVVGTYDDSGGRPSSYGRKFVQECVQQGSFSEYKLCNGGKFEDLERIVFRDFDTIFWLADVPNDKPKLVREIKKNHPTCMLVTSKRNDASKYGTLHLVSGALQTKSNLLIELQKNNGFVSAAVLDPLGNCFLRQTPSIALLATTLLKRLVVLRGFTRQSSLRIGEAVPFPETEWQTEFFAMVRRHAQKFHELVAAETERFLGNVSFRCLSGFPSFRHKQIIFVSKRNIDKRGIDKAGFVAVEKAEGYVAYYGTDKPSVDTPIQLALYQLFPRINFMLHGHTYVREAPTTTQIVPCGALQEVHEIQSIVPSNCNSFCVNLLGHGSLYGAEDLQTLADIPYIARPLPEYQE